MTKLVSLKIIFVAWKQESNLCTNTLSRAIHSACKSTSQSIATWYFGHVFLLYYLFHSSMWFSLMKTLTECVKSSAVTEKDSASLHVEVSPDYGAFLVMGPPVEMARSELSGAKIDLVGIVNIFNSSFNIQVINLHIWNSFLGTISDFYEYPTCNFLYGYTLLYYICKLVYISKCGFNLE